MVLSAAEMGAALLGSLLFKGGVGAVGAYQQGKHLQNLQAGYNQGLDPQFQNNMKIPKLYFGNGTKTAEALKSMHDSALQSQKDTGFIGDANQQLEGRNLPAIHSVGAAEKLAPALNAMMTQDANQPYANQMSSFISQHPELIFPQNTGTGAIPGQAAPPAFGQIVNHGAQNMPAPAPPPNAYYGPPAQPVPPPTGNRSIPQLDPESNNVMYGAQPPQMPAMPQPQQPTMMTGGVGQTMGPQFPNVPWDMQQQLMTMMQNGQKTAAEQGKTNQGQVEMGLRQDEQHNKDELQPFEMAYKRGQITEQGYTNHIQQVVSRFAEQKERAQISAIGRSNRSAGADGRSNLQKEVEYTNQAFNNGIITKEQRDMAIAAAFKIKPQKASGTISAKEAGDLTKQIQQDTQILIKERDPQKRKLATLRLNNAQARLKSTMPPPEESVPQPQGDNSGLYGIQF